MPVLRHPAQIIVGCFAAAILVGTLLLLLPVSTAGPDPTAPLTALFTATSAICVTGLLAHWSAFGEGVIIVMVQIGGLGIMTLATLFALLVSGRVGLRTRLFVQTETKTLSASDVRRVVRNVVIFSVLFEALLAVILTLRFALAHGEPLGRAAYLGLFHAVSAFNNAGFVLWHDSLVRFASDPWICLPIALAVVIGGLGFPVVFELARSWRRPSRWSVLTRITLAMTVPLLVLGTAAFTVFEWNNPGTFGALPESRRVMAGFFTAVMPRSGGFNLIDLGEMRSESWLVTDILMFIGGGSAGTAGGIKVTTFGLLAFVIWAELRGETQVNVGHRRLPGDVQRQALTIALLGVGLVAVATFVLLAISRQTLDTVVFEAISAFGTVGLSLGTTAELPTAGQCLLVALMFVGRIGPVTLFSALAMRERTRHYELPEERPSVG
jgi:trk system potassium uptake protein TrkH